MAVTRFARQFQPLVDLVAGRNKLAEAQRRGRLGPPVFFSRRAGGSGVEAGPLFFRDSREIRPAPEHRTRPAALLVTTGPPPALPGYRPAATFSYNVNTIHPGYSPSVSLPLRRLIDFVRIPEQI